MYACLSEDGGRTWSDPAPTPLIGHRPCLGVTRSGRLLVTYRDVGPDCGTKAWLGSVEELLSDFRVHGLAPDPDSLDCSADGLATRLRGGEDSCLLYALRPLSDPVHAEAVLEADLRVLEGERNACGLRLGLWFRVLPDRLAPVLPGARPLKLPHGRVNAIRLTYRPGEVTVRVNGRKRRSYPVDPAAPQSRPVLVGSVDRDDENAGRQLFTRLSLSVREPRLLRDFSWEWTPDQGLPDAWVRERVLELRNDRCASWGDFGYSGWAETDPERFVCVYHHGGGDDPGYLRGQSAHILATRFREADFPA
jgi:hypothetical protein